MRGSFARRRTFRIEFAPLALRCTPCPSRDPKLSNDAPAPARGTYAAGFEPLAKRFASQLRDGTELGAGLCVFHRGQCVVDLWGGLADVEADRPWADDTRIVVFSVTKGLAAMALNMLADRGKLDMGRAGGDYWPGFAAAGKEQSAFACSRPPRGLLALDTPLTIDDCVRSDRAEVVLRALEEQRPAWEPGTRQGYHALTFGLYASELFRRIAGESIGTFLRRELLEPLGSDARLGTPASEDSRFARLYEPTARRAVRGLALDALRGGSTETRVDARECSTGARWSGARSAIPRRRWHHGVQRGADPACGARVGVATASARGLARAYLPFASGGRFEGASTFARARSNPSTARQSWSERDGVLQKPIGWSQGFVKEEAHVFSPNPESFGSPGHGRRAGLVRSDPRNRVRLRHEPHGLACTLSAGCRALSRALRVRAAARTVGPSHGVRASGDDRPSIPSNLALLDALADCLESGDTLSEALTRSPRPEERQDPGRGK